MYREEYPRPQLRRASFINLNGSWQFDFDTAKVGIEKHYEKRTELPYAIEVPFCPESRLSGLAHTDFIGACWYRRTFDTPAHENGRVLLHLEAAYYHTRVFVNETEVGRHDGGYTPFAFDITDALHAEGENALCVYCEGDARDLAQPSGKQSARLESFGCFYTRTTGIWQTVWMEVVPEVSLCAAKLTPDRENAALHAELTFAGSGEKQVTLTAFLAGEAVGSARFVTMQNAGFATIALSKRAEWDLQSPTLYDLRITVQSARTTDTVESYFGLRSVEWDAKGVKLNGKYVFLRTVLDQGFYPDGVYTAPSDADLVKDIELSKAFGFNGARLHEKVFEQRFLYHCDRLGYLVFGEFPSWGFDYTRTEYLPIYQREWLASVERDYNHPAVIGWCPMNENWMVNGRRQSDEIVRTLYEETKRFDKTRPVIDVSWCYHVATDLYDTHDYTGGIADFTRKYAKFTDGKIPDGEESRQPLKYHRSLPFFLSEYGGFRLNDGNNGWGYGEASENADAFAHRFRAFASVLLGNPDICGCCYTQLYDVEQEQNGLYTYARKEKFSPELIAAMRDAMSAPAAIEE